MICQGLSFKNFLQLTHTCSTHIFCSLYIQKQAHKFPQQLSLLSYVPNSFKTKHRYHIIQPEECSGSPNHTMALSSLSPLVQSRLSGLCPLPQPLPGGAGASSGSLLPSGLVPPHLLGQLRRPCPSPVCLISPLRALASPVCLKVPSVSAALGAEFTAVLISTNLSRAPAVCWPSPPRADVLMTGTDRRHTVQPRIDISKVARQSKFICSLSISAQGAGREHWHFLMRVPLLGRGWALLCPRASRKLVSFSGRLGTTPLRFVLIVGDTAM